MRWALIQHVAHEGPGLVERIAERRGLALRTHRMDRGDPIPGLDDVRGLIVMGGPMGALDDSLYPHLRGERELLRRWLALGRPVLGICLGAQMLAVAAGGRVFRGTHEEIGVDVVRLTPAGRRDPLLADLGPEFDAFHWHNDTFELPGDALHLAFTSVYPNQAFRLGPAQYGLQFHIELTPDLVAEMVPHLPEHVRPNALAVGRIARSGERVLDTFFDLASRPPRSDRATTA